MTARPKSSSGSSTTTIGSRIGMNAPSSCERPNSLGVEHGRLELTR